ncbi:hypothetical protein BHM03_00011198 [Ensete ventricosum]|nr:hypothetical protein BHM03_00011198 [Ensete ventricosum]
MGGEKDGCGCWNLTRWQQQDEAVVARRCNGKGVVESDCGNEGSSGKGGGRDFMRSAGSSRQKGRRDEGTSVAEEGAAKEEVVVAAMTEGGLGRGRSGWEEKKGATRSDEGCGRGGYSKGKKGQRRRTATTSVRVLVAIEEEERGWPAVGVGASEEGVAAAGKSGRWQPIDGER